MTAEEIEMLKAFIEELKAGLSRLEENINSFKDAHCERLEKLNRRIQDLENTSYDNLLENYNLN